MIIQGFDLSQKRMLIAEIGNNHEGDPVLAKDLASAAIECGADAIKFQFINPERLVHCSQTERLAQLKRFQLPAKTIQELHALVKSKKRLFMASAFDVESLTATAHLLAAVKIASGDITFLPLLIEACRLNKTIILSTGGSTLTEIATAVDMVKENLPKGKLSDRLALLHCVSLYPATLPEVNLQVIPSLSKKFKLTTGFSDHTLGIETAIVSLSLGARIIEKHFTLDKNRTTFRDHSLSADPSDMKKLADVVHKFDEILGTGDKSISSREQEANLVARRSIVAARDLPAGTKLEMTDLDYLRPAKGLSPADFKKIVGKKLNINLKKHDLVLKDHLK